MRIAREDRSRLTAWWFTVDRVLLTAIVVLVGVGIVLSLAASPAVATRKGLSTYYFVKRHLVFAGLGGLVMLAVSMVDGQRVRQLALGLLVTALALMIAAIVGGPEINGAHRWVYVAGFSLQPSEIMKPAFVVVTAWLFTQVRLNPQVPALPLAFGLYALVTVLLLMQPDVGQWTLLTVVWGTLFLVAGLPVVWAAAFAGVGIAGVAAAYTLLGHVRDRIGRFLDPASGGGYQVERAMQSFAEGGLFGRGPGEGAIKSVLPDAHTDFIFAVVGEEYGAVACLLLVGLFLFIAARALLPMRHEGDLFTRLATTGLVLLFALQAIINMGVNVGLLPAKGMTLPLISSGGSSMVGVSLTLGILLALGRRRPDPMRVKKPSFTSTTAVAGRGAGSR